MKLTNQIEVLKKFVAMLVIAGMISPTPAYSARALATKLARTHDTLQSDLSATGVPAYSLRSELRNLGKFDTSFPLESIELPDTEDPIPPTQEELNEYSLATNSTVVAAITAVAKGYVGSVKPDSPKDMMKAAKDGLDGDTKDAVQVVLERDGRVVLMGTAEGELRDELERSFKTGERHAVLGKGVVTLYTDVVENTNATVFGFPGGESIAVTAEGENQLLGLIPDLYAHLALARVPVQKIPEFEKESLDADALPLSFIGRVVAANEMAASELDAPVLNRDRESQRVAAYKALAEAEGLTVTVKEDGTFIEGVRAVLGRKSGKKKVVGLTSGGPEAAMNMAIAKPFKKFGVVGGFRILSNAGLKKAKDLGPRYQWSEDEKTLIRELRPEDAEEILAGKKLFTLDDVKGRIDAAVTFITDSQEFNLPGVRVLGPNRFLVTTLRIKEAKDGTPRTWVEHRLVRISDGQLVVRPVGARDSQLVPGLRDRLRTTALKMVTPTGGILAADESTGTAGKRLASVGLENTPENRERMRRMLLGAPGLEESGIDSIILFDDTFDNIAEDGRNLVETLRQRGILVGIKTDRGLVDDPKSAGETLPNPKGLEQLPGLLATFSAKGAVFTKWRSTFTIDPAKGLPSEENIRANARVLALQAVKTQEAGLVPIVEPEVLLDGAHTIQASYQATVRVLQIVFEELRKEGAYLPGVILKTSMVLSGKEAKERAPSGEVGFQTLKAILKTVPAQVPAIVFLSGGQKDSEANENLNAITLASQTRFIEARDQAAAELEAERNVPAAQRLRALQELPWEVSYSFGRGLQEGALKAWAGKDENILAGRAAALESAHATQAARLGVLNRAETRGISQGRLPFLIANRRKTAEVGRVFPEPMAHHIREDYDAAVGDQALPRSEVRMDEFEFPAEQDTREVAAWQQASLSKELDGVRSEIQRKEAALEQSNVSEVDKAKLLLEITELKGKQSELVDALTVSRWHETAEEPRSEVRQAPVELSDKTRQGIHSTVAGVFGVLNQNPWLPAQIAGKQGLSALNGFVVDSSILKEGFLPIGIALRRFAGTAPIVFVSGNPQIDAVIQEVNQELERRNELEFKVVPTVQAAVRFLKTQEVNLLQAIVGLNSAVADEIRQVVSNTQVITPARFQTLLALDPRMADLADQIRTYFAVQESA